MNINRNNYEELYLLYVDGELSAQEREAVEQFMEDNPDTAHELIMLQQTKLDAEQIVFENKDSLYKISSDELSLQDHEERFLLYVDNELNDAEKRNTELFVLQHPKLQAEFTLLKQTKLEPEIIVFADKASLYRKEEKPVVYFSWTRLAVAAALIGFAVLVWTVIPFGSTSKTEIASTKTNTVKPVDEKASEKNNASDQPIQTPDNVAVAVKNNNEKKQSSADATHILNVLETEKKATASNTNVESKRPVNETIEENVIAQTPLTISKSNTDKQLPNSGTGITDTEDKNIAQQTVYKELDTEQDERRNNIYIGNMEINKDKVIGFFKRASHVFSRTKDEDSKIAVANFAIDTKALK